MTLRLTRILLTGATLLLVPVGAAFAGQGECETVLEGMQEVLAKRTPGKPSAGLVPKTLLDILKKYTQASVYEERRDNAELITEKNGNCFKITGEWREWPSTKVSLHRSEVDASGNFDTFPKINAYIFFKSPTFKKANQNLSIGKFFTEDSNGYMAISVGSKIDGARYTAGVNTTGKPDRGPKSSIANIETHIIWLERTQQEDDNDAPVKVVLCEGPCENIPGYRGVATSTRVVQSPSPENPTQATPETKIECGGAGPAGRSKENEAAESDPTTGSNVLCDNGPSPAILTDNKKQSDDLLNTARKADKEAKKLSVIQEASNIAIANILKTKPKFIFEDRNDKNPDNLSEDNLVESQNCKPGKPAASLMDRLKHDYKNCISLLPDSAYQIIRNETEVTIEHSDNKTELIVTYTIRRTKPVKISKIEVPVEMADGSKLTNGCALQFEINDADTGKSDFEAYFHSPGKKTKKYSFFLELNPAIAWKGKHLILKKGRDADCQPQDGKALSIEITPEMISQNGTLKPPKRIKLVSSLGKALLVLNTMVGQKSVNGSDDTAEFYQIADDDISIDILVELTTRYLLMLNNKSNGLIVGLYSQDGLLKFRDFSDSFKNLESGKAKELAEIIVNTTIFAEGSFTWSAMMERLVKYKNDENIHFAYSLFIGQSGLGHDKSYCTDKARKNALNEKSTFIFDFASTNNDYLPDSSETRKNGLKNFPALLCSKYHVVLFPSVTKPNWEKVVATLLKNAFKNTK